MKKIQQNINVNYSFPVLFTHNVFDLQNDTLLRILREAGQKRHRILVVVDSNVLSESDLMDKIERYADNNSEYMDIVSPPMSIQGGEACKRNTSEVEKIHSAIEQHHLCRHSFVLAIGGGAVLDVAGYAAATAHRGIRLIRVPTTTLAQNDAGVGVKNAINAFGRKNFIGTFAPPFAIINDFHFLKTLPERHLRSGIAEAVKVALIRDRNFFDFLYNKRHRLAAFHPDVMEKMIVRCAELHVEHIGSSGDPFEQGSTRPLDFGHWSAHKIEELTDGEVSHGDSVAVGIALDALYSCKTGLISEIDLRKIFSTLEDSGFDLYHWSLRWIDIEKAIKEFQEHLGGELSVPMLNGLGSRIDVHEVDTDLLRQCVNILAERHKGKEISKDDREKSDVGTRSSGDIFP